MTIWPKNSLVPGNAIQAGKVVDAEVRPRVRDHALVPQSGQLGAGHRTRSPTSSARSSWVRRTSIVLPCQTALPLKTDQVAERDGHPDSDRCGKLPTEPALEEFSERRRRFDQKGGKLGLGLGGDFEFQAVQLDHLCWAVGNRLLMPRRRKPTIRFDPERAIAEETAGRELGGRNDWPSFRRRAA